MSKHLCLRCDSLFGRCIPLVGQGCKAQAEQEEANAVDICISLALVDPEANFKPFARALDDETVALWGPKPPQDPVLALVAVHHDEVHERIGRAYRDMLLTGEGRAQVPGGFTIGKAEGIDQPKDAP